MSKYYTKSPNLFVAAKADNLMTGKKKWQTVNLLKHLLTALNMQCH